jgi:lipopolysaccharide export system permease protein
MKKLDKLILKSFFGPFLLTFAVVVFILLMQMMLKYLDDIVGKGLGLEVIAELLFYFSLNLTPVALPLAILLSSLMTFGTLGEHHELTAIKTSGISLLRILRPVFIFSLFITVVAFFFNNKIVPKANLQGYSLMWDIRQKKPTLDLKEGTFYNGLPGHSIKVSKKFSDDQTLKGIMIYDHTSGRGNTAVILADSGKMYTAMNEQYLVLELFNGKTFVEDISNNQSNDGFGRQSFRQNTLMLNLSSFSMDRTNVELFAENKMMKNITQLKVITDSLQRQHSRELNYVPASIKPFYNHFRTELKEMPEEVKRKPRYDSLSLAEADARSINQATDYARNIKSFTASSSERLMVTIREARNFEIEIYKKYTQSFACLVMFLIGAPLGAIIKKGGLGMPVIISIIFFIILYILSILGEKWGREGLVPVAVGMWAANAILLPVGLFFLYQARNDSSLLEGDFWRKLVVKLKRNKL